MKTLDQEFTNVHIAFQGCIVKTYAININLDYSLTWETLDTLTLIFVNKFHITRTN